MNVMCILNKVSLLREKERQRLINLAWPSRPHPPNHPSEFHPHPHPLRNPYYLGDVELKLIHCWPFVAREDRVWTRRVILLRSTIDPRSKPVECGNWRESEPAMSPRSWCHRLVGWNPPDWTGSDSNHRLNAWAWCKWRAWLGWWIDSLKPGTVDAHSCRLIPEIGHRTVKTRNWTRTLGGALLEEKTRHVHKVIIHGFGVHGALR